MAIETICIDSPQGRWTYSAWRPADLAAAVDVIWYSEGATEDPRERLMPNGTLELALTLGDRHRVVNGSGTEIIPAASLSGVQAGPTVLEHPSYHRVIAIRLRPAGAYAMLARPTLEVSGLMVDLRAVVGVEADELAERCYEARSVEARFQLLAGWLRARLARAPGLHPTIGWTADQIERSGGAAPIAALRRETGWSKSRLASIFREQIGVTPKVYARIVRFRRARALLDAGGRLVDVALAAGYYDQPHMNAEFRELSGLTPSQFLAQRYPGGNATIDTSA